MGGGRDKRKKAKPKQPGVGAAKTERKTAKNEAKAHQRASRAAQVSACVLASPGRPPVMAGLPWQNCTLETQSAAARLLKTARWRQL